ncbi:hypothetical protein GS429_21300 [Natronorubrum sp. JWXQ-INN-674]|uniref:Uncharacterized protein n=1 Tax=Natronorubrum halalkaliphilum TaxID=2691917 RepID=A0A6B0VTR6_9EURY|nr:hypothetical protein [Natronorubrum halalkaliphilum]MXV64563.1 hypothetical protein [Natronorubrum halalkaliphilum]
MNRTRRGTLALIAGSSGVLAADALEFSSAGDGDGADASADASNGATLPLEVTEDGLETAGPPFDGKRRSTPAPATFDIVNQRSVPVSLVLEADAFRFNAADDRAVVDGGRLLVGGDGNEKVGPGERIANVTVEIDPRSEASTASAAVTGAVEITAEGADTRIDAGRKLTLENRGLTVERALVESERTDGAVEHRWLLDTVTVPNPGLEALRFDYRDAEPAAALDFTDAEALSVTAVIDGTEHAGTIEHRRPNRLTVSFDDPPSVDRTDVELLLYETESPASLEGERGQPSGATLEVLGGGFSARVEGTRR